MAILAQPSEQLNLRCQLHYSSGHIVANHAARDPLRREAQAAQAAQGLAVVARHLGRRSYRVVGGARPERRLTSCRA